MPKQFSRSGVISQGQKVRNIDFFVFLLDHKKLRSHVIKQFSNESVEAVTNVYSLTKPQLKVQGQCERSNIVKFMDLFSFFPCLLSWPPN